MRRMQARRWSRVRDGLKKVFAIAMIRQQLTPPLTAQAALNNTGRWVATPSLGFSATHVVLLREPVTNKAKLFMFGESGSNQTMKFWTFTPDDATLVTPLTADPLISRLDTIPHPNSRRADLFCSGHATLPDGRMVLIGGGWIPTAMCEDSYTLDPAWTVGNPSPWTRNAEMSVQRWYATATSLPDGRVLASAGTSVSSMMGYGGTVPGAVQVDTCSRTLRPLELSARFTWGDTLIAPACGFGCTPPSHLAALAPPDDYTNSRFPPGRDYHMFAGPGYGQAIMYGGRRSSSTDLLDDVWLVAGSKLPDDSTHGCYLLEQVGDPSVVENGGMPIPRWGFGFTWAGTEINSKGMTPEFSADIPGNNICYIHGGKDANGNVLGDLWRGYMAGAGLHFKWVWKRILAHDASRARFGHVMMFDPGVPNVSDAPRAKLLIYGGLNASGTLADSSAVSAIGVGASSYQAGVWRTIPIDATQVPSPRARIWHSMTPRYKGPNDTEREYYLFGGEDVAGTLVDAQVRVLVRRDLLPPSGGLQRDDEAYKWELQSPAGPGPSARSRASLGYAVDGGTLVVFGGDTNGTQASGGLSNELFRLQAGYSNGSWEWSSPQGRAFHPAPPPTAGMPFVALGEGRAHITRNLEAFTASGQSNLPQCNTSGFGSWQSVSLPSAESERPIADYPNLHVLPDGRLFNAGPAPGGGDLAANRYRRFFNLSTKAWSDASISGVQDNAIFGSSVMYRPGKFLRSGSTWIAGHALTETLDLSAPGALGEWVLYSADTVNASPKRHRALPRTHGNLTVLPTGDVLATGGVPDDGDLGSTMTKTPQIWSVGSGVWSPGFSGDVDALAANPHIRNYHSIALLLPDARVLTAGGEAGNPDETTSSVFEPPYLFRSGGGYATRPRIQNGPELLPYGRELTVLLTAPTHSTGIKSIALVRPGAVTHGFDQGQRYIPLEFVGRTNPDRLLIHGPSNANVAPPGDYLLFVVENVAADAPTVPSVARWVRVVGGTPAIVDTADVTPPAGGGILGMTGLGCAGTNTLHVGWTAPADDDTIAFSGPARSYALRYALNANPPVSFDQWTLVPTGPPAPTYSPENAYIQDVTANVWYRVAVKAAGDHGDVSAVSNSAVVKGQDCGGGGGGGYEEGDGGGGGYFAARASQPASASGQAPSRENTLFPGASPGGRVSDHLKFAGTPRLSSGLRAVYLRPGGSQWFSIDRASLVAVDHPLGTETIRDSHGEFYVGTRIPAISVHDRLGRDLTTNASALASEPVYADSGEILEVSLDASGGISDELLLELSEGGSGVGGVRVEAVSPLQAVSLLGHAHPRRNAASFAFPLSGATQVRLRFNEACVLRFAGSLAVTEAAAWHAAVLSTATAAEQDWSRAVAGLDSIVATVAPGDTLRLSFGDVQPLVDGERDWYLLVDGMPLSAEIAAFRARPSGEPSAAPAMFALHQNVPNPFSRTTVIMYDLPRASAVLLEIFDAQGRAVRRFVTNEPAGRRTLEWDMRGSSGARVSPGIYTYRLRAGGFEALRKMVVMP